MRRSKSSMHYIKVSFDAARGRVAQQFPFQLRLLEIKNTIFICALVIKKGFCNEKVYRQFRALLSISLPFVCSTRATPSGTKVKGCRHQLCYMPCMSTKLNR